VRKQPKYQMTTISKGKSPMPKEYVEQCLCGNSLTQEDIDSNQCPECETNISSLDDRWEEWEQQQIERAEREDEATVNE
jgi:hypothetical protein